MTPVVQYMLLCDDVWIDPDNPTCTNIKCLMGNIVALEKPPFPIVRELICVYLVLTECYGTGVGQIRVVYTDSEQEEPLFGSPLRTLDFAGYSPQRQRLVGVGRCVRSPEPGRMRSGKS